MEKNSKGFAPILILILLLVLVGGVLYYFKNRISEVVPTATATPNQTPSSILDWKTYTKKEGEGYYFQYPQLFELVSEESIGPYKDDFHTFYSSKLGPDLYKKCVDEGSNSDGGCQIGVTSYLFHIVVSSRDKVVSNKYSTYPDWQIGILEDSQGQGSGMHASAYTTKGTKDYTVQIFIPDQSRAEKYLKDNNLPNINDLFKKIVSTFNFTN